MAEYTERQQRYLDCIAPISGITFVGFEPVEALAAWDNATRIALISRREHTDDEIGGWVVRTLKGERIMGEFFLGFRLDVHRLPYGRVQLASPWFWGRALWNLAHNLTLISIEQDYVLFFQWTEHCLGDSCYGAYRGIQPPANSPAFWG